MLLHLQRRRIYETILLHCCHRHLPFEWAFPHHTSNVTEIILQHSVIKAQYLSKLLVGIKALKRLNYDRQVNVDDGFENLYEDCPMETHQIIGALLEHTKQSLEYLSLTGGFHLRTGESDIHPCKGSQRDLEVVNEVVLNNNIYVEQASYNGPKFDPNAISYVGKKNRLADIWWICCLLPSKLYCS